MINSLENICDEAEIICQIVILIIIMPTQSKQQQQQQHQQEVLAEITLATMINALIFAIYLILTNERRENFGYLFSL